MAVGEEAYGGEAILGRQRVFPKGLACRIDSGSELLSAEAVNKPMD